MSMRWFNSFLFLFVLFSGSGYSTETDAPVMFKRLAVDSGWFCSSENSVNFTATYNGWSIRDHHRIRNIEIKDELLKNIRNAKNTILMSFFLFDTMYSNGNPKSQVTDEVVSALLAKKQENPNIKIGVILDPLNRAYSRRVPEALKTFEINGIDVFFSDLLSSKAATRDGVIEFVREITHGTSNLTGGLLGSLTGELASVLNLCIPGVSNGWVDFKKWCAGELDGHVIDIELAYEAVTLKANHRKVLVADSESGEWSAIVSSANPHNASDDSTNTALSVRGDLAKLIYNNLREDIRHSLEKENMTPLKVRAKNSRKFVWLSEESLKKYPRIFRYFGLKQINSYLANEFSPLQVQPPSGEMPDKVCSKYITEIEIKNEIIEQLNNSKPNDLIRIQMFYLSDLEVVEAIKNVANQPDRTRPVQLLLDPSKDAFNAIKDGTPNRQVAHYLFENSKNLQIRWYSTHGEQNHAKAMSISNPETGKKILITGSANWTGKNLNDINMEANLIVSGSRSSTAKFNDLFDRLWYNSENGVLYSWDYQAYDLETTLILNLGYEKIEDFSQEALDQMTKDQLKSISDHFFQMGKMSAQQNQFFEQMDDREKASWVQEKIEKDSSTTLRALSLLQGQVEYSNLSEAKKEKLKTKYLKKWTKGEKWGYVSW